MSEATTTDVTALVDTYIDMWNETDEARRADLISQAWATDGRYTDPMLEADGHRALAEMVAGVHQQFPGQRFRRTSGVDAHHGSMRFGWELGVPGGAVTVAGIDIAELDDDGRLQKITGFFGPLPDATA